MSNVFEGTGIKRYALRRREKPWTAWEYPRELEYDTLEEAQAALETVEGPAHYESVEKLPILWYVTGNASKSRLLENLLAACGRKPYMLQRHEANGFVYCPDLQFDTKAEAEAACTSTYRVVAAKIDIRYEPVEVMGHAEE